MQQQRKVTGHLKICAAGHEYDVSGVPGIMVGELVDVEAIPQGLKVSRHGHTESYVLKPMASSF